MTGAIQTQAFQENYQLPGQSLYEEYRAEIAAQAEGSRMGSRTPARTFARAVLDDVMAGHNGVIYRGRLSSFALWVGRLVPQILKVSRPVLFNEQHCFTAYIAQANIPI